MRVEKAVLGRYITDMSQGLALQHPLRVLRTAAAQVKLRARSLWRAYPRETAGLGIFAAAAVVVIGGVAHSAPELAAPPAPPAAAAGAPPPVLKRALAPDPPLQVTQGITLDAGPNPAGMPLQFEGSEPEHKRAVGCP